MKIVQGLFFKYFKSCLRIYHFGVTEQRFFSRNFYLYSNFSTALSNYTTPFNKNECIRTAELSPECALKLISLPQNDEKLLNIINEVNYAFIRNRRCPEFLNSAQLYELYALETKSQRMKYLHYLFKQEKVKEKDRLKKEENKAQIRKLKDKSTLSCVFSKYGLGGKTLLLNVRKQSINKFHNQRLANAALFGNKIVIDLDYDKFMVEKERKSCAAQLRHLIVSNKRDSSPFDLYFCNANHSFKCVQYLKHDVPNIEDSLNTLYEGSYLDIFPKDHLVYLSPHASESLKYFDPNAIYIIGGFVDVVKKEKISTEKASTEGIKSFSLPLDDYVKWKSGSKSLTVNQVFEIMLTLKNTGDWKKAFERSIPVRKAQNMNSEENEQPSSVSKMIM